MSANVQEEETCRALPAVELLRREASLLSLNMDEAGVTSDSVLHLLFL